MFYINEFLTYLKSKRYNKSNTIKSYYYILNHFESYCNEKNISEVKNLTEKDIYKYLESIRRGNISERYYYLKISRLKIYLDFLEQKGFIFIAPLRDFSFPKYLRKNYPVLRQEEIEYILDNIKEYDPLCIKGRTILEILYSSALRPAEVANLKITDIDFNKGQLFIEQSKKNKDRIVPVGKKALSLLSTYITETRKRYLKENSPNCVFLNFKTGKAHNSYGIRWIIRETLKRNGVVPIKPYSVRGTSATVLFLNGMGIAYINKLLGHQDFTTTKIYLRVSDIELKKVLDIKHPRLKMKNKEELT